MTPSMKILGTRNRPSRLYKARALSPLPSPPQTQNLSFGIWTFPCLILLLLHQAMKMVVSQDWCSYVQFNKAVSCRELLSGLSIQFGYLGPSTFFS